MDERNRLTPISLTREYPVSELVVYSFVSAFVLFKVLETLFDGIFLIESVKPIRVDVFSVFCPRFFLYIYLALQDFDDGKIELLCKFPVSFIVCRNSHNSSCTIGDEDIVGNPNRKFLSIYRVNGIRA